MSSIRPATGPGFRLISAEVKDLTSELIEEFRNLEPSPTERPLDARRIRHLRTKADLGELITFHWAIAKLRGKMLRMNGQHSSAMLSALDGQLPAGLKVHLDMYEVDTDAALALLFRQFDDRKSGRTPADVSGAYQGLQPDLLTVMRPIAKLAVESVAWYDKELTGLPPLRGDDIYSLFNKEALHGFIRWTGEILGIKTPEMKRVPVVAAMYATYIVNEAEANTFWSMVARGDDFDENAPPSRLDAWLRLDFEDRKNKRDLKPAQYYQGAIYCWNAHREGKTITVVKFDTKKGMLPVHD